MAVSPYGPANWFEKPWSQMTLGEREDLRVCAILADVVRRLESEQPVLPFPSWVWDRTTVELNPLRGF